MRWTDRQIELYSRQIILPELGGGAQRRLQEAAVLVLGGDAGSATAASYLAGAGVGHLEVHAGERVSIAGPAPSRRNPEIQVAGSYPGDPIATDDQATGSGAYDLVVVGPDGSTDTAIDPGPAAPRLGWIEITAEAVGTAASDQGACAVCLSGPSDPPEDPTAVLEMGGATAALVGLRWLAGLDRPANGWLRFEQEQGIWRADEPRIAHPCPRACRA